MYLPREKIAGPKLTLNRLYHVLKKQVKEPQEDNSNQSITTDQQRDYKIKSSFEAGQSNNVPRTYLLKRRRDCSATKPFNNYVLPNSAKFVCTNVFTEEYLYSKILAASCAQNIYIPLLAFSLHFPMGILFSDGFGVLNTAVTVRIKRCIGFLYTYITIFNI